MAEFCGDCKFKSDCDGDVVTENISQYNVSRERGKLFRFFRSASLGTSADILDAGTYSLAQGENGGLSEIFPSGRKSASDVAAAIGHCAGPRSAEVCGAFPEARRPYEETIAARIMDKAELKTALIEQLTQG